MIVDHRDDVAVLPHRLGHGETGNASPVGAENPVTVSDQRLRSQPTPRSRNPNPGQHDRALWLSDAYLALAHVLSWLALLARSDAAQDGSFFPSLLERRACQRS